MNAQIVMSQGPYKLLNYYLRSSLDIPWFETDQHAKNRIKSHYEDHGCVFVKYEFNDGFEKVIEVHLKNYDFLVEYLLDDELSESRSMRKLYDAINGIVNSRRELLDVNKNKDVADVLFDKIDEKYILNRDRFSP